MNWATQLDWRTTGTRRCAARHRDVENELFFRRGRSSTCRKSTQKQGQMRDGGACVAVSGRGAQGSCRRERPSSERTGTSRPCGGRGRRELEDDRDGGASTYCRRQPTETTRGRTATLRRTGMERGQTSGTEAEDTSDDGGRERRRRTVMAAAAAGNPNLISYLCPVNGRGRRGKRPGGCRAGQICKGRACLYGRVVFS
jgi:hypothetical protein